MAFLQMRSTRDTAVMRRSAGVVKAVVVCLSVFWHTALYGDLKVQKVGNVTKSPAQKLLWAPNQFC